MYFWAFQLEEYQIDNRSVAFSYSHHQFPMVTLINRPWVKYLRQPQCFGQATWVSSNIISAVMLSPGQSRNTKRFSMMKYLVQCGAISVVDQKKWARIIQMWATNTFLNCDSKIQIGGKWDKGMARKLLPILGLFQFDISHTFSNVGVSPQTTLFSGGQIIVFQL